MSGCHDKEHDRVVAGLITHKDLSEIREAVCIHTRKIYDSCREKDCIEDARVIFPCLTHHEREIINNAFNVKVRRAVVKDVITDVEAVPFKRGFFTVDVKFIIRVTLDFFTREDCSTEITTIRGDISFDKKIILFGSDGGVKIFESHFSEHALDKPIKSRLEQDNLPIAVVEVAEPIPLSAKIRGILDKLFEDEVLDLSDAEEGSRLLPTKRVFVTVGLFSIVKLIRLVQLLIPAFNFCYPTKRCIASTEEEPCRIFETIEFPLDEFFPPQKFDFPGAEEQERALLAEAAEEDEEERRHHHHHHHHHCR